MHVLSSLCCKSASPDIAASVSDDPFTQMVVLDYYDGPAGGLLKCGGCDAEYHFYLLDWDSMHHVRIFALAPLPSTSFEQVFDLFKGTPDSAVWIPPWPTNDDALDELETQIQKVTDQAGDTTAVNAWSIKSEQTLAIRGVDAKAEPQLRPLFEHPSDADRFDWFGYLGLEKT